MLPIPGISVNYEIKLLLIGLICSTLLINGLFLLIEVQYNEYKHESFLPEIVSASDIFQLKTILSRERVNRFE